MMNDNDRARIDRLEAEVLRLSAEIAALRPRQRADPEAAAALMPAIIAALGGEPFTSADLRDHAALPGAAALRAAIFAAVGSTSPRKIGKFLCAIEGRDFDGLSVHRLSSKLRPGILWKVVAAGMRV